MANIHATAVVDPNAKLGSNVKIGPLCVIGPDVEVGDGVVLQSHVALGGRTTIGAKCKIFPFASVGQAPQDIKYHDEPSTLPCGLRLLDAVLRDSVSTGVAELIRQLAASVPSERDKIELVNRIKAYLESEHAMANTKRLRALLVDLRSIPSRELGDSWQDTLDGVDQRLKDSDKNKTSDTSQSQSP